MNATLTALSQTLSLFSEPDHKRIPLTVDPSYASNWTVIDGLREIIQNALDAKRNGNPAEWSIRHDGRYAIIEDKGDGLRRRDFLLGGSRKDHTQIGQFGEGLKLALLVFARNNRYVFIESVGMTVYPDIGYNEQFQADVLHINLGTNRKRIGTTVKVECTKDELDQAKALFLQIVAREVVEPGIYVPGNQIFINGLKTTEVMSLFSYNIADKSLTNRDRTIIQMPQAEEWIRRILSRTESKKVVHRYLTGWIDTPNALEYRLNITPMHSSVWKTVSQEIWHQAVLPSNIEDDFIAHTLGYQVLRNIPQPVRNIAEQLGVKNSSVVASQHRNKGLVVNQAKIVYPMTESYVSHWTVMDALRELVANARDTKSRYQMKWSDGILTIEDSGPGLAAQAFVFGGTHTKGSDQIGQFNEGLKLACLVLAREGRFFEIKSMRKQYTGKIERDPQFGLNFLAVYVKPCKKRTGTEIRIACSEEEFRKLDQMFRPFNDPHVLENGIIEVQKGEEPGIYVLGLKASRLNSVFSYNLDDKRLTNRDRKIVDLEQAKPLIRSKLERIKSYNTLKKLLLPLTQGRTDAFEYQIIDEVPDGTYDLWKKAVLNLFTRQKICFEGWNWEDNRLAREEGWKLIPNSMPIARALREAGMKSTEQVVARKRNRIEKVRQQQEKKRRRAKVKELPDEKLQIWQKGTQLFKRIYSTPPAFKLVKVLDDPLNRSINGVLYNRYENVMLVRENSPALLSLETFVGTLILLHERKGETKTFGDHELVSLFGRLASRNLRQ